MFPRLILFFYAFNFCIFGVGAYWFLDSRLSVLYADVSFSSRVLQKAFSEEWMLQVRMTEVRIYLSF